jgi:hypothetical protein
VPPIVVPWPASGQVTLHVNLGPNQFCCYRLVWADPYMDPQKFGRISVVEQPGSAVMQHRLQLNNNGVSKWDSGWGNTGPECSLSNAPTPGSPSQVMCAIGDTLDVIVENGDKPPFMAASNILIDFLLPSRY